MSHVTCRMSCVMCHVSRVTCHMSHVTCLMSIFFVLKWWSLLVEGLLSTGPTPSSLFCIIPLPLSILCLLKFSTYFCTVHLLCLLCPFQEETKTGLPFLPLFIIADCLFRTIPCRYTVYSEQYSIYDILCTVYIIQCIVVNDILQYKVQSVWWTVHSLKYTV